MAQRIDGIWVISPQDLISEYECTHKVALDAAVAHRNLEAPKIQNAALDLLRTKGLEFEAKRLDELPETLRVKKLATPPHSIEAYHGAWKTTSRAMDEEYDVIYQATLFTGDFVGFADFLIAAKDETGQLLRDDAGRVIYEPVDTKSARSAKTNAIIQVGAYADALVRLGRPAPLQVHLWLKGDSDWSGPAEKYMNVAREYRERLQASLPSLGAVPTPLWAPPCAGCGHCRWTEQCDTGRREARDISLIQEIRATTRAKLVQAGLGTMEAIAAADDEDRPSGVSVQTFERLRAQAAIQIQGEQAGEVVFEIIDEQQLNSMPPRSPGDLWFDMEGDPHARDGKGLEYMFGYGYLRDGEFDFDHLDAYDSAGERAAFEAFIDHVMSTWAKYPDMHVYHYANYERAALLRLAQRMGTREAEVDMLLRAGRLVDLYTMVRKAFRFSTESLSIKYIEKVYGLTHADEDVSNAMASVIEFEKVLELRAEGRLDEAQVIFDGIVSYNRLDCESTMKLDDWIRQQMTAPPRPTERPDGGDGSDDDSEDEPAEHPTATLIRALEAGLPPEDDPRTPDQQARALLAAALQYHRREARPAWWKLFELIQADVETLESANDVLLIDEATGTDWQGGPRGGKPKRTLDVSSHTQDAREVLNSTGDVFLLYENAPLGMRAPAGSFRGYTESATVDVNLDGARINETSGAERETWEDMPIAVLPGPPVRTKPIESALANAANLAYGTAESALPLAAWTDLLLGRPPRRSSLLPRTEDAVEDVIAALESCPDSYVAVQGPPGTGKTYVGSKTVARLAAKGWRVGVVAQSHSVVNNFLAAVAKRPGIAIGKEPQSGTRDTHSWDVAKLEKFTAQQGGGYVIGGTAWTFSRPTVSALNLDLLVIDEAGQFALPNAIACALAAQRVLLLGDPQQLPQVSQAAHPDGIEDSVLAHVSAGAATLPENRGYFLAETYRMHPAITERVSKLQYEGKLVAAEVTSLRHLDGINPGVHAVEVPHEGNTTSSTEEAREVVRLTRDLIGRQWTGARDGATEAPRTLTASDVIVVAAYNAQVRLIRRQLEEAGLPEVKVGTVDKFQGREEVAVIVSMATSSADDLPRGIEFLLSPNRLNVAISRAQWVSYIVHSPTLRTVAPTTVVGLERLGGFLGLVRTA
jgi:predicted RecB family nuclease